MGEIRFERLFADLRRDLSGDIAKDDLKEALHQLSEEGSVVLSGDIRNYIIRPS